MPDMKLIRHPVAGFVIFAIIITLSLGAYNGFKDNYDIIEGDIKSISVQGVTDRGNIAEHFERMNLISGISTINSGISKLNPGSSSNVDILGSLASVAIGVLKTIFGLFTFPIEIVFILLSFYAGDIPAVIGGGITVIIMVYAAFIILSAYLKHDV